MKWFELYRGSTATPRRPPSPSVLTTLGTLPMSFLVPLCDRVNRLNDSRSVITAEPLGRKSMPHGMLQPLESVVIFDGTPPPGGTLPVCTVTALLGSEELFPASFARTV